jgi:hypothetical protein
VDITQDIVEESEDERFDDMSDSAPPIELPPCELSRLEEINEVGFTDIKCFSRFCQVSLQFWRVIVLCNKRT